MIRRRGVRSWESIRPLLCRVVKRSRSRPNRFQIVSRFQIAAGKVLHPRDCADSGGSNAARNRAWKYYLQQFSDETGLEMVVGHYPAGTSKWNKIEHRVFSFIGMNWRGEPVVGFETVVNMISSTKTKQGPRLQAMLDPSVYATGVKITDEQMQQLNLQPHRRNPEWNYSLPPRDRFPKHP